MYNTGNNTNKTDKHLGTSCQNCGGGGVWRESHAPGAWPRGSSYPPVRRPRGAGAWRVQRHYHRKRFSFFGGGGVSWFRLLGWKLFLWREGTQNFKSTFWRISQSVRRSIPTPIWKWLLAAEGSLSSGTKTSRTVCFRGVARDWYPVAPRPLHSHVLPEPQGWAGTGEGFGGYYWGGSGPCGRGPWRNCWGNPGRAQRGVQGQGGCRVRWGSRRLWVSRGQLKSAFGFTPWGWKPASQLGCQ